MAIFVLVTACYVALESLWVLVVDFQGLRGGGGGNRMVGDSPLSARNQMIYNVLIT